MFKYYIAYKAVTIVGNEYNYWTIELEKEFNGEDIEEQIEYICEQIRDLRYDGRAAITIINWKELK